MGFLCCFLRRNRLRRVFGLDGRDDLTNSGKPLTRLNCRSQNSHTVPSGIPTGAFSHRVIQPSAPIGLSEISGVLVYDDDGTGDQ